MIFSGISCEKIIDQQTNQFLQKHGSEEPSPDSLAKTSQQRMYQIISEQQQEANQIKIQARKLIDQKGYVQAKQFYERCFDDIGLRIQDVRNDEILTEDDRTVVLTTLLIEQRKIMDTIGVHEALYE